MRRRVCGLDLRKNSPCERDSNEQPFATRALSLSLSLAAALWARFHIVAAIEFTRCRCEWWCGALLANLKIAYSVVRESANSPLPLPNRRRRGISLFLYTLLRVSHSFSHTCIRKMSLWATALPPSCCCSSQMHEQRVNCIR